MIKLIVYDWNGTILSDMKTIVEGTNKELEVLGREPMDLATYRKYFDTPIIEFYKKLGVSPKEFTDKSEQIATAFHSYYEPQVAKASTRPGARKALSNLYSRNFLQIILSNHSVEGIYFQLERLKLVDYFDTVLANETITNNHFEGKEQRLKKYMAKNIFKKSEAVIVGDTVEEIRIGHSLGIKTISITGGYNSTERLQAAKPDIIISSLNKLVAALEELSK